MKKANNTFRFFEYCLTTALTALVLLLAPAMANACEMPCAGSQQVSLDENCEAEITASMMMTDNGASCPGATYTLAAKLTEDGPIIYQGSTVILDGTYVNTEVIIEVTSDDNGIINKCWGTVFLEDKLSPVIECDDVTITCDADSAPMPTFENTECGATPIITLINQTPDVSLCDPDYLKEFTQTFTATDAQGNVSDNPCTRTVTVRRIDTDAIVFPSNYRVSMNSALSCDGGYETIEPGSVIPALSVTGVPSLYDDDLIPAQSFSCNTVVTYSDLVLPEVNCVTKVMRTFTISEWICGEDQIIDSTQIIEIVDNEGPSIEPLSDVSISTSTGFDCEAVYLLPQVFAEDNCKDVAYIDIAYPDGFISDYDGSELIYLGVGNNDIAVTAYDGCGNSTTERFTVNVEDNNAPVAVCDQNTVVALSSNPNGLTTVAASTFDDGSYDECGLANPAMSVMRMDEGSACGLNADEFDSYVQFCCSDIGSNPIVVFRVTDLAGNSNTCMVNVELQDKLPATISAPADMTVDCSLPFDFTEAGLIAAFGDASATDNCGNGTDQITRSFSDNTTTCSTGILTRFFSIPDGNGGFNTEVQNITFVNDSPFDIENDIDWPNDVTLNACLPLTMGMATEDLAEVSPDATGRPILDLGVCDMVGVDYDDMVFEIFNSSTTSCFKIIRTFTVGDWCGDESISYQQSIMVINTVAPTFELGLDAITQCTFDGECVDGEVVLRMAASDDCTPAEALSWQYAIDAFNDGTIDITSPISSGSEIDSINGKEVSILDATGDYPIGNHRIIWSVEDRCGNLTRSEQLFTVENCKTPTPYCYNGLAISLMEVDTDGDNITDDGMVEVWASDFNAGSFHLCGYDVTVSFSSDPTDTNRTYTCDDIGVQDVEIWASATLEDGSIVQDFCTSFIDVQDNMNICPDNNDDNGDDQNNLLVSGNITTEDNQAIEEVRVEVINMSMDPATTDQNGYYSFTDMETDGVYSMHPSMDTDHLNGVTTIDLVLIQRHILGLDQLSSAYKVIAADINKDGVVSAKDLLSLRKSILGITKGFTNNESWRFIDKSYSFIDPINPLTEQFTETYDIAKLSSNMELDFIGVKTGDVNESVIANGNINAKVRNSSTLDFAINNQNLTAGSVVEVPVYADNFNDMIAYQYTMELSEDLEFLSASPGSLDLSMANFGTLYADEGIITTSWDNYAGKTVARNDALFFVKVRVVNSTRLIDAIEFNSALTKAEAYSTDRTLDVNLNQRSEPLAIGSFALYQNTPNPFYGITNISFELPKDDIATLNIYDVTGKLVKSYRGEYVKGMNSLELDVRDLGVNGVLYYTLQTEDYTATKKMVVIR